MKVKSMFVVLVFMLALSINVYAGDDKKEGAQNFYRLACQTYVSIAYSCYKKKSTLTKNTNQEIMDLVATIKYAQFLKTTRESGVKIPKDLKTNMKNMIFKLTKIGCPVGIKFYNEGKSFNSSMKQNMLNSCLQRTKNKKQ